MTVQNEIFKTEDVTAEFLKKFIESNPVNGDYWVHQEVDKEFLAGWRSPDGMTIQQIEEEVARVTNHYNKQVGTLVEAIQAVSYEASCKRERDWDFIDAVDSIAQAAISQYGYDSYSYGTWVQSNY